MAAKYKIFDELMKVKSAYETSVMITDGLPFNQKMLIRMIEHYTNSKYLNGNKDELGRDKPFFNILNGVIDVENAAKDLDTKDIQVISIDGNHQPQSFMLQKETSVWMNETNFAKTLNDIRDVHSRYGSVLAKKVFYKDENGKKQLRIDLPAWKNIWNDPVNILQSPIVELQWMLPSEIMQKEDWKDREEAIKAAAKDTKNRRRVPVYELRGEFPKSFYRNANGETVPYGEDNEYSYQLYYLSGEVQGKLFCLYKEDDTEKVYKYLARKPKPGRDFGVGIPEEGEEAQVWTNDAVLKQYRAMEYTSKVVGQSATKKLRGRNILTEMDDGQIIEHEEGKPITAIPLLPPGGMAQYGNLINQWYDQFEKVTSAYAGQRGEAPPSHTPFRLQALVLQQSNSVFKQLRQELGIFIEGILNDWVLPYLADQLTPEHILAAKFSPEELKEIDNNYAAYEANAQAKEKILNGEIVTQEEYDGYLDLAKQLVGKTKSHRFLQIPKNYYKNLKAKILVITTGEQKNKAAIMESLSNLMMVYMKNPQATQDPVLSLLFKQIVEMSGVGISPVQFQAAVEEQSRIIKAAQAANPQPAPAPGMGNQPGPVKTENAAIKAPAYAQP